MGSVATDLIIDPAAEGETRGTSQADDKRFFRYLLLALALHALLLIRVQTAEPRRLGAPEGADDAISVSIITERDINGRATVKESRGWTPRSNSTSPNPTSHDTAAADPAAGRTALTRRTASRRCSHPRLRPPRRLSPRKGRRRRPTCARPCRTKPSSLLPKAADPKPAPEKTKSEMPSEQATKSNNPDEAARPVEKPQPTQKQEPAEKPAEAKPKPPAKKPAQKTETANLDLTPPAVFQAPVGGGGAGVQQPVGITRSGENDDFARGVIRALQSTTPQLRNPFGRVTVRIELNMNGNVVRTTVLKPSNIAGLDQSVVFATQPS